MRVEPFALELAEPLTTADGTVDVREGFLLAVDLDGTRGVGEATPLAGWTESREACREALESLAEADPESPTAPDPESIPDGCPAARHAVELAVADAEARFAHRPLYRHLGCDERVERVPVNATVGDGPPAATADRAREAVVAGFPAVKVKVGARSVATDRDRLAAVREACPDVELRADANGAWDRETAREALAAFADLDLRYLEQPLPGADVAGLADLAGGKVAVAADESVVQHDLDAVIDAADVVVLKPMALGGPRRALVAARRARDRGVQAVVTTTVDGAVARAGAVHVAAALSGGPACGLATGDRLAEDLGPDPAPVDDGAVRVPQKEGNIPPFTWPA